MATLLQTGQVKTNSVGLAYARQSALGTIPTTGWTQTEPNTINEQGASITTVARNPISLNRQRRKGTVTDLDSPVGFEADTTMDSFRDFIGGFLLVETINGDVTQLAATGAETTGDTYTGLTALVAAQAAKFVNGTLIWVNGGAIAANNGLKQIDTDASATDTALAVADNLTDESGASFEISFAGFRIASTDSPTWTWSAGAKQATLAGVTGLGTTLIALGLTAGQIVHIGSIASLGGGIQNAFENSAANDMFGYARVVSIAANSIVFDKVAAALQFTDGTAPATAVDIVFGEFLRNVPVNDDDFCEIAYTFEAAFPGLGNGTPGNSDDAYQYAIDNFASTMAFVLPLQDKATITFGFVGTDTQNPTTTRATGASAAAAPVRTAAFNTTSDIARLRITEVDEDGITTDFKSLTLNLNNNVSKENVLGQLAARFINFGNFDVDIEAQLLFTNPLVVNKIRDNETVTMDFILKNDDGVIAIDIPSMTLGGGGKEFPVNESVLINTTAQAFGDPDLGTSIGVSIMPVPLP